MQRDKISAEVSRLCGYSVPPEHCCGMSGFGMGVDDTCPACNDPLRFDQAAWVKKYRPDMCRDWLVDKNWPILLHALLAAGRKLEFHAMGGNVYVNIDNAAKAVIGADEGEAVCRAWLIHMNPVCTCERHWDTHADAVVTDSYRCLLHHK